MSSPNVSEVSGFSITLDKNTYSPHEIAELQPNNFPEWAAISFAFCQDWLKEREYFELKTSGSTGAPKVMRFHRRQMEASARLTQKALQLKERMTALVSIDTSYIGGKMMLVRGMTVGMNLFLAQPTSNPFSRLQPGMKIDFMALVPYQVKTILASSDRIRFNEVNKMIIGGGEIDSKLEESLQAFDNDIFSTYGMTETISHIALRRLNGPQRENSFHTLDGVTIKTDSRGCLVVNADYLGESEIVTNDIVDLISPTQFRWLGRWDNVINSGGVKVIPEKVEKEIEPLLIGRRFFLHGFPHHDFGWQVVLIIEGEPLAELKKSDLLLKLRTTLSRFELPRQILYAPAFVETATGKINRTASVQLASPLPLP